jgi:hypothetical protein
MFEFWRLGYNPFPEAVNVMLTTGLRRELNDLMTGPNGINSVIQKAIVETNQELGSDRVHFVDTNTSFNRHRWCEDSNFHEPDESRQDTWFFCSGWKDYPLETDQIAQDAQDAQDLADF